MSDMIVVAKVDDRDISLITDKTTGEVSPKARPSLKIPFTVEAIVPLSQDGNATLALRATLSSGSAQVVVDTNGYFQ